MKATIIDYIKQINELASKDDEKNFKANQNWPAVKDLSLLLGLNKAETLLFSHAYFLTITKEHFESSDIREALTNDPYLIGEIIQTLNTLDDKGLIHIGRDLISDQYRVTTNIVIDISMNKKPTILNPNKDKDFFEVCDDLVELFLMKMENMMSFKEFHSQLDKLIDTYSSFKPFIFLKKKRVPKEEWPIFLFTFLSHIHGEKAASVKKGSSKLYYGVKKQFQIKTKLINKTAVVMKKGFLAFSGGDFKSTDEVMVTEVTMKEILGKDFEIIIANLEQESVDKDLLLSERITKQELFYNEEEGKQLDKIAMILKPNRLHNIQKKLLESGHKEGVCILLHGQPGTGKTESVLQMARKTGRPIMKVEIASIRDKYIGESEKNLLEVFKKYEHIRKNAKLTPILLFNEADALLNKRVEVRQNSDQMNNAMQNILLEELENFKGIMFATTNLANNLDTAFERRFLFKVEFNNPDSNVRRSIWLQHFPQLKSENISALVENHKLSGGQIENIVRKVKLDNILNGGEVKVEELIQLCKHEFLNSPKSEAQKIGFRST